MPYARQKSCARGPEPYIFFTSPNHDIYMTHGHLNVHCLQCHSQIPVVLHILTNLHDSNGKKLIWLDISGSSNLTGLTNSLFPQKIHFGPRVYPKGSLVITSMVRPSVCVFVFKYLRDCSLVFSSFLHEVRAP